jgi:hypothetical protein
LPQRGKTPRRFIRFDQMKVFQSAYVGGRFAMAEPEGHTAQRDFFVRAYTSLRKG